MHLVNPSTIGIKRSRPLMIDSHSTLTNINDNLLNISSPNSNSSTNSSNDSNNNFSNKRAKITEQVDYDDLTEGPLSKHIRLSPLDHSYLTKVNK